MIRHFSYSQLGKANHGWLETSYHFSFAYYYNPERMGFGTLRVINDDWVMPGTGFSAHPHQNMEIISFIRSGEISHQDDAGNTGITRAGEVQVMSAGKGVVHSEYNLSEEPLTLFQIWIRPNQQNVTPRWESKQFPTQLNNNRLPLLVSGYSEDAEQALFIHQKAKIYGGKLAKGASIKHRITHQAYVVASKGTFELTSPDGTIVMQTGDGAEVTDLSFVQILAQSESELLIVDAP